jgi:hypothetical protein
VFKILIRETSLDKDKKYLLALVAGIMLPGLISIVMWSQIKTVTNNEPFAITTGIISKIDCSIFAPRQVGFLITYSINGISYTERPGNDYINCDRSDRILNLHDTVDVWVSKNNFHYISLASPELVINEKKSTIFILLTTMSLFVVCLIFAYKYYERKTNKSD